ncbi:MAG TPA: PKD domain-containing protein [Gemmatimonadaceae bacterium]|jgi:alpha-tubulin suppressor-like RCC1 family protein
MRISTLGRRLITVIPAAIALIAAGCNDQVTPTGLAPSAHSLHTTIPAGLPRVSAGNNHACALRSAGTVICWGDNGAGQLNVPTGLSGVAKISAGGQHTCALKSDGSIVCWGSDSNGQLDVPAGVGPATDISAGWATTCGIFAAGAVKCWGWDYNSLVSGPASFGRAVRAVSVNYTSTCVIAADDNTLHCWGANDDGGVVPPAGQFQAVAMAAWGGCALALDSTVSCWGYGAGSWFTPPAGQFTQISSAGYNACVLSPSNDASCFGISGNDAASNVAQVSAGGGFDCAVKLDATISCFGSGTYTPTVFAVPVEFGGPIPPTVTSGGPYTGAPGQAIAFAPNIVDPQHNASAEYWEFPDVYQDEFGPTRFNGPTPVVSFPGAGTYSAIFTVETGFGTYQTSTTVTITDNSPPVAGAITGGTVSTAGLYTASGTITDPSSTSWTATADYGDGSGAQPVTVTGSTYTLSHQYEATGKFTITVTVTDNQGASSAAVTSTATVTNAPPDIATLPSDSIIVGNTYTATGSFTDPSSHTWSATVSYGDGSSTAKLSLTSKKAFTLNHDYKTAGVYTVTVQIKDNQGATGTEVATVTVQGAAAATTTLVASVAQLAASGAIAPAAATAITNSLNAAATAIAAGNKIGASVDLAEVGLTILNELRLHRMTNATADQLGAAIALIVKAMLFP